jgi:selT/selW/selH-like putative selenoprotein
LAAALSRELKINAELVKGSKGIFDVAADGKMIFSKYAEGRYPKEAEIVQALRQLM